jgi:hypothetical protein
LACSFVQNARCFMWHLYSKKEVSILFSGFSFGHEGLEMTIHSISDGTPAKSRKLEQNYVNFPVLSKLFNHPLPSTRLQRNEPPLLTTRLFFHIEEDLVHFSPFLQKLGQLSTKRWFIPGLLQLQSIHKKYGQLQLLCRLHQQTLHSCPAARRDRRAPLRRQYPAKLPYFQVHKFRG